MAADKEYLWNIINFLEGRINMVDNKASIMLAVETALLAGVVSISATIWQYVRAQSQAASNRNIIDEGDIYDDYCILAIRSINSNTS